MKPPVETRTSPIAMSRLAIDLATLIGAPLAQAGVYSAENFRSGVRA